ncbi:MAG: nickel-dependent hydrogenase large subunit [Thiohalocapsa sp.]
MSQLVVGPFNRVEGDLEVRLEINRSQVTSARVNAPLYRGFEQILHGKDPMDTLVIAPRICGICSVSQSTAAALALADLAGCSMPPNGELACNLTLACENLADHFSHFYLFFMPDFARAIYADESWHDWVQPRFQAMTGSAPRAAMPARAQLLHLMGMLAGKWPHSLSLQPGGSTKPVQQAERLRLLAILSAFRSFLERQTFGDSLEALVALDSAEALAAWADAAPPHQGDLRAFLHLASHLALHRLGRGPNRFMSYGNLAVDGQPLFQRGLWHLGPASLNEGAIAEDLSRSWMQGSTPLHPSRGITVPDADKAGAYSWCKAPRLSGEPVEVGALARQLVDGHPLIRDLVATSGGNVRNRVVARLLESARLLIAMEHWVRALRPGEPFCSRVQLPEDGSGVGLTEAARGSLGHWIQIRHGRILNYQIIAPTTWNFSPRDSHGTPGPLEQALVGAPVRDGEQTPVAVQHVVRSFDPCMVCTVH